MTRKVLSLLIAGCFLSSTLYAQELSFEQRTMSVQAASQDIVQKLDALIARLDRGAAIQPADIEALMSDIRAVNDEIGALSSELKNVRAQDKTSLCSMIRLISLAWLGIGAASVLSLLGPIIRILIDQATPDPAGGGVLDTISTVRQYLTLARKALTTALVVPLALTNALLAGMQYRECMKEDF